MILCGCKDEQKSGGASSGGSAPPPATTATDEHKDHIALGEKTVGAFKVVAEMEGAIKPGGDGGFDLAITGGEAKAVRVWVGTESAEGSVKARTDVDEGKAHIHVEIPNPLPPGSKFWIEIEPVTGEAVKTSFDLKS